MSSIAKARRTEVRLTVEGADATDYVKENLISFTYTDYAEDNADDISLTLDDRDGRWLGSWLNSSPETPPQGSASRTLTLPEVGQSVMIKEGASDYDGTKLQGWVYSYTGFKVLEISETRPDRIVVGIGNQVTAAVMAQDLIFSGGNETVVPTSDSDENGGNVPTIGSTVNVKSGAKDYNGVQLHDWVYSYAPGFTVLEISRTKPDRVVIGIGDQVTAAVRAEDLLINGSGAKAGTASNKGLNITAAIVRLNFNSDGKDSVLDCGSFEADEISAKGPPQTVTVKATSLPYTSTLRNQLKTKAWESIRLSAIAEQIAKQNGFECMFLSEYDPLYTRREQIRQSDITFLRELCAAAGISLKCTAKMLVLFDGEDYGNKDAVLEIVKGESDVKTFTFNTGLNDTAYSSCHVCYTDPTAGNTIEYTYTPKDGGGSGQVLEINEKVTSREEARQLAMKRLRQKNKKETSARFTLVGNTGIAAGCTISVKGYGMFDGRYFIDTATHNVTGSGYTTEISCTKTLEEY